jgi:hypothetical protein
MRDAPLTVPLSPLAPALAPALALAAEADPGEATVIRRERGQREVFCGKKK